MSITRREFCGGALALTAAGRVLAEAVIRSGP